ncbi:hypothetical protein BACCAP_00055 [Pseudoflavonifractor capillosus ATCC 29799]|uniref:Uncharacterized protein n=1 Tax=Pseudoflavonifractor capillosus ATCC 29799 TaxID=411467 RepID=A6NPD9_9FIRM|nr:hypothetical protein [Pseudoflavonifractor capillosus]EDN02022.1 hypothetical protein BACCAP_00055 [Pseudoflavonifractor capillosus ATCC 29799]
MAVNSSAAGEPPRNKIFYYISQEVENQGGGQDGERLLWLRLAEQGKKGYNDSNALSRQRSEA